MREIGIGVIGWGFMGKTHTHALREMPLFYRGANFVPVLKCVCSGHIENAVEAAKLGGFESWAGDYRELLKRSDIEVVSICSPNSLHAEMAVEALENGKHVYIDKPLAMNAREARLIADAAKKNGRLLQVANNNRFFPSTMLAKKLIDEGRVGDILSFRFKYLHSGSIDPNRPIGWKQTGEGGVLLDLGSHALDMLMHLCGNVRSVCCDMRVLYPKRPDGSGGFTSDVSEDQVSALVKLENGALGHVEASKIATGTDDELSFEIEGIKGAIRWSLMDANYLYYYDNEQNPGEYGGNMGFTRIACVARFNPPGGKFLPIKNTIGWDRAHMHCYYSFLDAIVNSRPVSPDAEEALRLQIVMDAMKTSDAERRWVDI
ncbi:MAG: Gfo/Idh/MocA family oxidoreductase [Clostridia bacterium]|nr:Gfo/Idh/MocA family oxidoreductase [Clostridia bacterium]